MGRFRAEAVMVKQVDNLTIVFYDKESIYIKDDIHGWTVFHRWFVPKGLYGETWKPFRKLLWEEKQITFNHCYRLAFRYSIQSMANVKPPDLSKVKIVEKIFINNQNKEVN